MSKYNFTKIRKDRNVDEVVADEVVATNTAFNNPTITIGSGITSATRWVNFGINSAGVKVNQLYINLIGLQSSNNTEKVIGINGGGPAFVGSVGPILGTNFIMGKVECIKTPTVGTADIDVWASSSSTKSYDDPVTSPDNNILNEGPWTQGDIRSLGVPVSGNNYIYLATGVGGGAGTYGAGEFLVTFWTTN